MNNQKLSIFFLHAILLSAASSTSLASTQRNDVQHVCDTAAFQASRMKNVPLRVLKAIARTESGVTINGKFAPWPWTVNLEGRGFRFDSADKATNFVLSENHSGASNIDIGCFQINYRWHGKHFSSVREMFDPYENALYAAEFLASLYREFQDWNRAVGAYHSRNREFSDLYLVKYKSNLAQLDPSPNPFVRQRAPTAKPNSFPLLKGQSGAADKGSLFPLTTEPGNGFFTSKNDGN